LWLGTVVLIIFSLAVSGWIHRKRELRRAARAEIDHRLDLIRAAGQPVTAQDLVRLYPNPPSERDAAKLLAPTLQLLSIPFAPDELPFFSGPSLPAASAPLDFELREKLETLWQTNGHILRTVPWDELTNSWLGLGLEGGFNQLSGRQVRPFVQLARAFLLNAVAAAENDQATAAGEQLRHGLALGRIFRSGIMLHHVARRGIEAQSSEALERVVNRTKLPVSELRLLEQMLAQDHGGGIREAFLGVQCLNIWTLEQIRKAPARDFAIYDLNAPEWWAAVKALSEAQFASWTGRIYNEQDFIQFLESTDRAWAALNLPPEQRFAELLRITSKWWPKDRPRTVASVMTSLAGMFPPRAEDDAAVIARLRTARVALAILRWRAAHEGRLPESLAELVPDTLPAIPEDPFDEQPLRYRRLPQGFLVYSIGPDFADDGGREKPADAGESERYDITFTVER